MTDSEILAAFQTYGINGTIEEFIEAAIAAGSPGSLKSKWIVTYKIKKHPQREILYNAIVDLWKIHLKHMKSPEVIASLIEDIEILLSEKFWEIDEPLLLLQYETLKNIYFQLIEEAKSPNVELFNAINNYRDYPLGSFLKEMVFYFACYGLIEESVNTIKWFSVFTTELDFFKDAISSEVDKNQAIRGIINKYYEAFPDDTSIMIRAGDSMHKLKDIKLAEEYYLKAYETKDEELIVLQRLFNFYKNTGMNDKALKYQTEYEKLSSPPQQIRRETPKISRNDPCPCGSGKKFKKCCLIQR